MPLRFWIRTLEPVFLAALALAVFVAWRADRRDRAQLASELAATKQLLAAADARQHDRDAHRAESPCPLPWFCSPLLLTLPFQIKRTSNPPPTPSPRTMRSKLKPKP